MPSAPPSQEAGWESVREQLIRTIWARETMVRPTEQEHQSGRDL